MRERLIVVLALAMLVAGIGRAGDKVEEKGLVGYWSFDEGKGEEVEDSSGNDNHGEILDAEWATGKFGSALKFNGESGYVDCGDDDSMDCEDALTVAAWIYLTAAKEKYFYNAVIQRSPAEWCGYIFRTGDARVNFLIGDGEGWHTINGLNVFTLDTWHHIAVTYKANQKIISYIDGELDQQTDIDYSIAGGSANLSISQGPSAPERTFNGIIDEVKVYSRALSAKEVKALYKRKSAK